MRLRPLTFRSRLARTRSVLWGLLLVCVAATSGLADEKDDKAKAERTKAEAEAEAKRAQYARDVLKRRALDSVRPGRTEEDGVARDREAITERREESMRLSPRSVAQIDVLVGPAAGTGLIGNAERLHEWMIRTDEKLGESAVVVFRGTSDRPNLAALAASADAAKDAANKNCAPPPVAEDVEDLRERLFLTSLDVLREGPDDLIYLENIGSLKVARRRELAAIAKADAPTKDDLKGDATGADLTEPYAIALTEPDELSNPTSRALLAARAVQVAVRLKAFAADEVPAGLVSERAVEEKSKRADNFRRAGDFVRERLAALDQSMDVLARAERELGSQLGGLGYRLEDASAAVKKEAAALDAAEEAAEAARKKAAAALKAENGAAPNETSEANGKAASNGKVMPVQPPEAAEPERRTEATDHLDRLQLKEVVLKLKMRLLYLAVHRIIERRTLYQRALEHRMNETRAAEAVAEKFRSELVRVRRERQLERLDFEEARLTTQHTEAHERARTDGEAEQKLWQLWDVALEKLLDVNQLTAKAVRLRRAFEDRVKSGRVAPEDAAPKPAEEAHDPLRRLRNPSTAAFTVKYVEDARSALDHPAFDDDLVALHHSVVQGRVERLREGVRLAAGRSELAAKFQTASAAAAEALGALRTAAANSQEAATWFRRADEAREENLLRTRTAFEETLRGVETEEERARELARVSEQYLAELQQLGPRSFGIRVQRTLDGESLGMAYDDVHDGVLDAGRWATGRGEENIGTFIAKHWLALLGCLGIVVGGFFAVRVTRHALDRVISAMARRVPQLRSEPVTVRAEEAQAKREKAEQEIATRAAEEEALRLVSKDEAAKAQKMGEGGYGGEG